MSYEKELFRLDQPHGSGELFFTWQKGSGVFLATRGKDNSVCIFNRQGKLHERIKLAGHCLSFGWDSDGDLLGLIYEGSYSVMLWDSNTGKKFEFETGLRDPLSVFAWAKNEPLLAVGTLKGNLFIYNHKTAKRIPPILGKHQKRIVSAAWSDTNLLALGSEDKTISISDQRGDTVKIISISSDPSSLQMVSLKSDEKSTQDVVVSAILGKLIFFVYNLNGPDDPKECNFQERYGNIVAYEWYGDRHLLVGFSAGYLLAISTKPHEFGQELYLMKNHHVNLTSLAASNPISKMATCGDSSVKIHDLKSLSNITAVITLSDEAAVDRIGWSEDGQLLLIATHAGSAVVYVSKLARLYAVYRNIVALLTSLAQLTIYLVKGKSMSSVQVKTEVEPTLMAIGPYHLVVGMNNRTWIYDLVGESPSGGHYSAFPSKPALLGDRDYVSTVTSICLNGEYTSALSSGKLHLHLTEGNNSSKDKEEKEMKVFPDPGEQMCITCHFLTSDFLVYGSDLGDIRVFGLDDWVGLTNYRHMVSIKNIYPDSTATRIVIIDAKSEGYLYSPINNSLLKLPMFSTTTLGALWDQWHSETHVFVTFDSETILTYIYERDTLEDSKIICVGETKLPLDQIPLVLQNGAVTLETPGGNLTSMTLSTHVMPSTLLSSDLDTIVTTLDKNLALLRYPEAWNICLIMNNKDEWEKLARHSLAHLEIEMAIRVYKHIGNAGMVFSLQSIQHIENKKLLAGRIAEIIGNFDKAQSLYLESSEPINALTMRQNLLQWDQALQLARKLDPYQIPFTAYEYANQLELTGQYSEALVNYDRAYIDESKTDDYKSHNEKCRSGIARTSIRVGDYRRGLAIANDPNSTKALRHQCAEILESSKKLLEAASMFEKAESYDQAASAYIALKNWKKVGELLPKVTQPKIYQQYAKVKESDGDFPSAVKAYHTAGDVESVVRILLDKLNQPQHAVTLVQETKNVEGAKLVAKFFENIGDYASALRFLVLSRCENDALRLCKEHGLVELYANIVSEEMGGSEDGERQLALLAVHFEQQGNLMLAAKCYYHAAQFNKALKNLLHYSKGRPSDQEALDLAIEVVGAANDDGLSNQVIDLLLGEIDGKPRDPKYVFRLYKVRKQYKEAAKTAIIIANEELVNGNYSNAHSVLLGMCIDLHDNALPITVELMSLLTLLHSYRLVRLHVKRNDHYKAARMLLRVADNISKFPAHIVPILTSTVIECHRANLKASAFQYAAVLMRPEYRSKIEPKYLKKLEGVVRKPPRGPDNKLAADEPEQTSPCPFCSQEVLETQLSCTQCNNSLPFCIATGRHILREDFTTCPNCQFPAIKTELGRLIESGEKCPMCSEVVEVSQLVGESDFESYIFQNREE